MEITKFIDADPTPKLKSSPIQISFVSFNVKDANCIHCGNEYTWALLCNQKYCKKCLSLYLTNLTDNNVYLDVYYTMNVECSEHGISKTKVPHNIQEILCFKQTPPTTGVRIIYINNNHRLCKNLY